MNNPNIPNPDGFNDTELEGGQPQTPGSTDPQVKDAEYWKNKFSNSAKGAQDLLRSNEEKDRMIAELKAAQESNPNNGNKGDAIYEGFAHLPEEERQNVLAYTQSIKDSVRKELLGDPAFVGQRQQANEAAWEGSFARVAAGYPDILDHKEEFKSSIGYDKDKEVPSDIDNILTTLVRSFLYNKQGAAQPPQNNNHVDDTLRNAGGSGGEGQGHTLWHTLAEWDHMRRTKPQQFADNEKKWNEDLNSGKL